MFKNRRNNNNLLLVFRDFDEFLNARTSKRKNLLCEVRSVDFSECLRVVGPSLSLFPYSVTISALPTFKYFTFWLFPSGPRLFLVHEIFVFFPHLCCFLSRSFSSIYLFDTQRFFSLPLTKNIFLSQLLGCWISPYAFSLFFSGVKSTAAPSPAWQLARPAPGS